MLWNQPLQANIDFQDVSTGPIDASQVDKDKVEEEGEESNLSQEQEEEPTSVSEPNRKVKYCLAFF